jgi:hypothetical protein
VRELSVERRLGESALYALQVSSRSPMGAIALETGGLLIDHGWIRVLGGGSAELPRTIHEWNDLKPGQAARRVPGAILVADDVIGGLFAVNGGGLRASVDMSSTTHQRHSIGGTCHHPIRTGSGEC